VAVDEVEDLIGVEGGLVLDVGEAAGGGLEQGDPADALRAEAGEENVVVLVGERAEGAGAGGDGSPRRSSGMS